MAFDQNPVAIFGGALHKVSWTLFRRLLEGQTMLILASLIAAITTITNFLDCSFRKAAFDVMVIE